MKHNIYRSSIYIHQFTNSLLNRKKFNQTPSSYTSSSPILPPISSSQDQIMYNMLVNCSGCHVPLQLPPGARSIRCALCQAVTNVADPRAVPPHPSSPSPDPRPQTNPGPPAALAPSPYNHAPPGPPPPVHGRKKAVIVGVSYRYSRHELKGCLNDAKCMKHLLMNKFQFPEASILMLTGKFASLILIV